MDIEISHPLLLLVITRDREIAGRFCDPSAYFASLGEQSKGNSGNDRRERTVRSLLSLPLMLVVQSQTYADKSLPLVINASTGYYCLGMETRKIEMDVAIISYGPEARFADLPIPR